MKRKKFMGAILALSIGLLGTGYAYWADELSLMTTVSTGNFNVDFVEDEDEDYDNENIYKGDKTEIDVEIEDEDDDDVEHNKAQITVEKIYPGRKVAAELEYKNLGTIPAKVGEVIIKDIKVFGKDGLVNNSDIIQDMRFYIADSIDKLNYGDMNKNSGVGVKGLAEAIQGHIANKGNLSPDQADSIAIGIALAKNTTNSTQSKSMSFSIEMPWVQYNYSK